MVGSNLSQRLRDRRRKIDLIDRKLLPLLNQRLCIALEIGKIKKQMGTRIYDPKREKEILEKLSLRNRGPLTEDDLKKIFAAIIKVCRQSQR
jgi:chorismate mutase